MVHMYHSELEMNNILIWKKPRGMCLMFVRFKVSYIENPEIRKGV